MWTRKELKTAGKRVVKLNYWKAIAICFLLALIAGGFSSALALFMGYDSTRSSVNVDGVQVQVEDKAASEELNDIYNAVRGEHEYSGIESVVVAGVNAIIDTVAPANSVTYNVIKIISKYTTGRVSMAIFFLMIGIIVKVLYDIFLSPMFQVGGNRFFMESRKYNATPLGKIFMVLRVGKTKHVAWVMFNKYIFTCLWSLTIIGGPIKRYQYMMIPYILAENPGVSRKDAFAMSKAMMKGNKWRAFILDISYIPWRILDFFSVGILSLFFLNPYVRATETELYMFLRNDRLDKDSAANTILCDKYLDPEDVTAVGIPEMPLSEAVKIKVTKAASTAADKVGEVVDKVEEVVGRKPAEKKPEKNKEVKEEKPKKARLSNNLMYPVAMLPVPVVDKAKRPIRADRKYSVTSYILMFFVFSLVGWLWEVGLHLVEDGVFVNRGTMLGPWLPIYGCGAVLCVMLLRKWMKNPIVTFLLVMFVCSVVEYATSWYLELTKGIKWWDYSGYFMNLNGRICLLGATVFGLGGCAAIYFIAPRLDDLFKKIPMKVKIALCAVLISTFGGDAVYSHFHPNTGKGITDYAMIDMVKMMAKKTTNKVLAFIGRR